MLDIDRACLFRVGARGVFWHSVPGKNHQGNVTGLSNASVISGKVSGVEFRMPGCRLNCVELRMIF